MTARADELRRSLAEVRERVAEATRSAGRVTAPQIIAVTKTHPAADAQVAVDAGFADLGENRVQELVDKYPQVEGGRWHLIGPLQSNKVGDVVGRACTVHTISRAKIAARLDRLAGERDAVLDVLLQVNIAEDPAKAGCSMDDATALADQVEGLANLRLRGLMTIPPLARPGEDANVAARPHFSRLRELRDRLHPNHPELIELSMGMSADLEAAVAEGATYVRLGSAIFGTRGDTPRDTTTRTATNRISA